MACRCLLLGLLNLSFLFFPLPSSAQPLEKVRVGMPSFSLSFIAPRVAQVKGLFRAEGMEVELIQMATTITIVALTTKGIDYSTSSGGGLRSAVRGLPVRVVMSFNRRPLHVLVAKPEIRSLNELRGRIVGFAGYGDTTEFLLRAILRQANMDLEKDVQALQIAGSGPRLTALLAGKIESAILPPPFNFEAEAKGFGRLMAAADVFEGSVSGFTVNTDKLRENPGQIKRMIRAVLKAQTFIRENKSETVRVMSEWLKLEPSVAAASYDLYLRGQSPDGLVSEESLLLDINRARQALKIKEEVPLSRVVDFSIVREALGEMKMAPSGR
ncbi:MAG: ABC transporter substrate-binding protein [Deltaproteobacteria bacterium]|nr:ABC transporter substrate-binding protein [Deltaproteobacteria bacterium]